MSTALQRGVKIIDGVIHLEREIRAIDINRALAKAGGKFIAPTTEQELIIESKHWGAAVVIAGAGSGKTETMTQRVLWLVANGVVRPDEILGLTFTRKAAGELHSRIRRRLRQLRKAGLLPVDNFGPLDIAVEIATYHSYAGRTLAQHGIRIGIDADIAPLGEAAAWELFSQIVAEFPETQYPLTKSPNSIVDAVISLSSQISEHDQHPEAVRSLTNELLEKFASVDRRKDNEELRKAIATAQERLSILPMVEAADRKRHSEGRLTFDDQMSLAATLVTTIPEISVNERSRYKVVLLDEYQDTSQSQVRFLSALFGSAGRSAFAVTAVGDPHQAIYGWRGASADTLDRFASDFTDKESASACQRFTLLTSWRNDRKVLDFANHIVDQLTAKSGAYGRARGVDRLALGPKAADGALLAGRYLTARDEAVAIANHFAQLWHDPARLELPEDERSSFAVLLRAKSYIPEIEAALREAGLEVEVVGLGGLIHIPEIADIIALLRTLTFPDAGTALARLLLSPRLAIGPRDLMALGRFARERTEGSADGRSRKLEEALESGSLQSLANDDFAIGSIIEALDQISEAKAETFSREGLRRLTEFSTELALLRRQLHGSITDILIEAERFLRLDTELLVRDGWESGRRHLDAFIDEAALFQRNGGTLSTFLRWLEVADKREGGLKPATITVSNRAVQLLTIHTAKGAEWDHVAVPGLVKGSFPSTGKKSESWLKNSGSIPLELRADSLHFGFSYEFPSGSSQPSAADISKSLKNFDEQWQALRIEEEYRLAYVAFTRARHSLIATASIYRDGSKEKGLSEIYHWLKEYLDQRDPESVLSDAVDLDGVNPLIANPRTAQWPISSERINEIINSAEFALTAKPLDLATFPIGENKKAADAVMIINEIAERKSSQTIYLPDRLSVSTLLSLKSDPEKLAGDIRRPMPDHSNPFAKLGSEFHQWLERHFQISTLFDDEAFDPAPIADVPLKELQSKWLASEWADRRPVGVEVGFETVLDGLVVKGRIDAVYQGPDGRFEVIDWKSGRERSGEQLADAAIQLALYRLAYAKLHKISLREISAGFHYINENITVRPVDLLEESALIALLQSVERSP